MDKQHGILFGRVKRNRLELPWLQHVARLWVTVVFLLCLQGGEHFLSGGTSVPGGVCH